jgi:predicted porin
MRNLTVLTQVAVVQAPECWRRNAEVWAAGLKYDANNIYLATTYSETRNMTNFGDGYIANKAQNFEVVAQYQFDFGLRPSIAYLKSKGKDIGSYGDQDLVEYVDVGATTTSTKTCLPMLITKSTCLTTTASPKQLALLPTTSLLWV